VPRLVKQGGYFGHRPDVIGNAGRFLALDPISSPNVSGTAVRYMR
jgi:hypothetical protein